MRVWSRSFLLGLLVIVHLQFCVEDVNAVKSCCFSFHSSKIPLAAICDYKNVNRGCPKSGVIFTVRKSRVCADPNQSWVKRAMNKIDQRLSKNTEVLPGCKTKSDAHPASKTKKPHTSTVLYGRNTEARVLLKPDPSTTQHEHEPEADTHPEPTTSRSGPHTDPHEHEAQTQAAPETSRSDPAEPTWFCYV